MSLPSSVGQPAESNKAKRRRRVEERIPIQRRLNNTFYERRGALLSQGDSLVYDGERVFIVDHAARGFTEPVQEIDYFHGLVPVFDFSPTAQMCCDDETDVPTYQMIALRRSCFVAAVVKLQRVLRDRMGSREPKQTAL